MAVNALSIEARAHALTTADVLKSFDVVEAQGLSPDQVESQRQTHGKNGARSLLSLTCMHPHCRTVLPDDPPTPLLELILQQFKDLLVLILLGSAVISFGLALLEDGDKATAFVEPIVILLILIANAVVGVVQETNAEKAIDVRGSAQPGREGSAQICAQALMEYSPDEAKVVRAGKVDRIHASDLVPGDIIQVAVGDRIPADARVLFIGSASFTIDQALLTGESVSVSKSTAPVPDEQAVKQDMVNMLFSVRRACLVSVFRSELGAQGTTVVTGSARAVVTATGTRTAIGDIHTSITSQISEKTPLKQKLDDFSELLAKVITVCVPPRSHVGYIDDEAGAASAFSSGSSTSATSTILRMAAS
jgi:Ca2+ transporting ATPase